MAILSLQNLWLSFILKTTKIDERQDDSLCLNNKSEWWPWMSVCNIVPNVTFWNPHKKESPGKRVNYDNFIFEWTTPLNLPTTSQTGIISLQILWLAKK